MTRTDPDREELRQRISRTVEARRQACNLSPDALARAARVDLSQMVKILGGKGAASLYSLDRIAKALGWTLGELLTAASSPRRRSPRRAA